MLSLLSNSFREAPVAAAQSLGWSKKRREHPSIRSRGDPAAKRLKTEVMALTNRERARIKNIPRPEAGHRLRPNSMIETRFAKLPRVPVTPQKINSCKSSQKRKTVHCHSASDKNHRHFASDKDQHF